MSEHFSRAKISSGTSEEMSERKPGLKVCSDIFILRSKFQDQ